MDNEATRYRGTFYFLGLAILYACLYLLVRAFLPKDVHFVEAEAEFVRHALVLGVLGWGAFRWGRGWAWAGVVYLAGEFLYRVVMIAAGTGVGIDPHILVIKAFILFLGTKAAKSRPE